MLSTQTIPPFGDPHITSKLTADEPIIEGYSMPIEWEGDPNTNEGQSYDVTAYLFINGKLAFSYDYRIWRDWGGDVSEREVYDAWVNSLEGTSND